jgi:CBS domain-containing protein
MLVKDILQAKDRRLITVGPDATLKQAMELLLKNKISSLPVLDDDEKLIGIISDKDIFRKAYEDARGFQTKTVGDCMSTNLIVGLPEDDLAYIAGVMTENRIRHVPIVHREKIIGLLSVGDIVKTQMEHIKVENRYLWQYIEGTYPG